MLRSGSNRKRRAGAARHRGDPEVDISRGDQLQHLPAAASHNLDVDVRVVLQEAPGGGHHVEGARDGDGGDPQAASQHPAGRGDGRTRAFRALQRGSRRLEQGPAGTGQLGAVRAGGKQFGTQFPAQRPNGRINARRMQTQAHGSIREGPFTDHCQESLELPEFHMIEIGAEAARLSARFCGR